MFASTLLKGSLSYSPTSASSVKAAVFQFNPETISRLQTYTDKANATTESIRFELVLNAVDGLEQENETVLENGIYPQLAILEELMAQQNKSLRRRWPAWLLPSNNTGFLMFTYGERQIPVKLQRLNIMETLHNNQLTPVYAKVGIVLRVLTSRDLRNNAAGIGTLKAYKRYRYLKAQLTPGSGSD